VPPVVLKGVTIAFASASAVQMAMIPRRNRPIQRGEKLEIAFKFHGSSSARVARATTRGMGFLPCS
jgi:hypothetical protein